MAAGRLVLAAVTQGAATRVAEQRGSSAAAVELTKEEPGRSQVDAASCTQVARPPDTPSTPGLRTHDSGPSRPRHDSVTPDLVTSPREAGSNTNTVLLAVFVALVFSYFAMAAATRGRTLFVPELALDRAIPLEPAWMPVYISLWVFSFLPLVVVRGVARRGTILAYITTAIAAYVGFLMFPASAPRPDVVPGDGVLAWGLRTLYALDPPYNCFPSLHVAYSFLAAQSAYGAHRGFGVMALLWAVLVGISTLFIKQHYVADVVAGALLALAAYALVLGGRRLPRLHSARRAIAGSNDPARRDGHQTASKPAPANAAIAAANASGSRGVTPTS